MCDRSLRSSSEAISFTAPPNPKVASQSHFHLTYTGWSWGNFYDVEGTTIRFSDGETFIENGIFGFVGFQSTIPLTSMEISSPSSPLIYDHFSFVEAPVPEPALGYAVAGICIALAVHRVRKQQREASSCPGDKRNSFCRK
jgi:hypothetical protein